MPLADLKKRVVENVMLGLAGPKREEIVYTRADGVAATMEALIAPAVDTATRAETLTDTDRVQLTIGRDPTAACGGLAERPQSGDTITRADGSQLAVLGEIVSESPEAWTLRTQFVYDVRLGRG